MLDLQKKNIFQYINSKENNFIYSLGLYLGAGVISRLYGLAVWGRNLIFDLNLRAKKYLPVPVIGVGNLTVGGAGKTPLIIEIVRSLSELGLPSAVISRGYGGKVEKETILVSEGFGPLVSATIAGDEAILLAKRLAVPVVVGVNRLVVGQEVLKRFGVRVLVADDLFQYRSLHRDLDIVILDVRYSLENIDLLPAGILRESINGLRRAQVVILTHADDLELTKIRKAWLYSVWGSGPILACSHRVEKLTDLYGRFLATSIWKNKSVIAFCCLADPKSFIDCLWKMGLNVVKFYTFPDHYFFSLEEIKDLQQKAKRLGARAIVTTEKDQMRIPFNLPSDFNLWVARLKIEFIDNPKILNQLLVWGLRARGIII